MMQLVFSSVMGRFTAAIGIRAGHPYILRRVSSLQIFLIQIHSLRNISLQSFTDIQMNVYNKLKYVISDTIMPIGLKNKQHQGRALSEEESVTGSIPALITSF
ncbi:hypothetical protein ABU952_04915 [Bacillus amyloliquefaciens]|uniref:hypothetical protein n=1 Tax=Bacillus amyloliquefaciens TaxID=1390 RepID=UPI00336B9F26